MAWFVEPVSVPSPLPGACSEEHPSATPHTIASTLSFEEIVFMESTPVSMG
jgi:hypothetical protein